RGCRRSRRRRACGSRRTGASWGCSRERVWIRRASAGDDVSEPLALEAIQERCGAERAGLRRRDVEVVPHAPGEALGIVEAVGGGHLLDLRPVIQPRDDSQQAERLDKPPWSRKPGDFRLPTRALVRYPGKPQNVLRRRISWCETEFRLCKEPQHARE